MTKKEKKEWVEARVFAALYSLNAPADAEEIADSAGDEETNEFCTPPQATSALKMYEKLGLVEDAGEDPTIKRARRRLKRWQITRFGRKLAVAIIHYNDQDGVL